MVNSVQHASAFFEKQTQSIRGFLSLNLVEMLVGYIERAAVLNPSPDTMHSPKTHCAYGDPVTDAILELKRPDLERLIGCPLLPTYSYYRRYVRNDKLRPHVDRDECEISVSVSLSIVGAPEWPLFARPHVDINNPAEVMGLQRGEQHLRLILEPGDGVVYLGRQVKHWRTPFQGESATQLFLHYVRADGPFADLRFDGRERLGLSRNAVSTAPNPLVVP